MSTEPDSSYKDRVRSASRARSFLYITAAYAAALAVAWATARWLCPGASPLIATAYADLAATLTVFAFSRAANNSSVYDPYWSVAPLAIAPFLASASASFARKIMVISLVTVWGLRLTYNWARGFADLSHEDFRYVDLRDKTGRAYWLVSLAGLHLFPTVQVYLGCLPLSVALTSARPLGPLDAVAFVVTLGAIAIEAAADEQMRAFRRARRGPDAIMDRGLWAYSRHPNYFGEVGFWCGLFLFAIAADPGASWTAAGLVSITLMFAFASIPMMDRRSLARRPAYADHMKRVSALVPWFPKR